MFSLLIINFIDVVPPNPNEKILEVNSDAESEHSEDEQEEEPEELEEEDIIPIPQPAKKSIRLAPGLDSNQDSNKPSHDS